MKTNFIYECEYVIERRRKTETMKKFFETLSEQIRGQSDDIKARILSRSCKSSEKIAGRNEEMKKRKLYCDNNDCKCLLLTLTSFLLIDRLNLCPQNSRAAQFSFNNYCQFNSFKFPSLVSKTELRTRKNFLLCLSTRFNIVWQFSM